MANEKMRSGDVLENNIRDKYPEILKILLIDRTKKTATSKNHNIIWATDNYAYFSSKAYKETEQILPELITGENGELIRPRALKNKEMQKKRTKSKAEVHTPTWIVKKQNDAVDENYKNDDLETYVKRTWLEITCGEAPYMATRYDMETGELIDLDERVGFVDRKLRRINQEVHDKAEWQRLALWTYKSSYGFEWSGDSLLLARENLLYTYMDYHEAKFCEQPSEPLIKEIAEIISWNVFQMDGLKYIVPLSEHIEKVSTGFDLFTGEETFIERGSKGKKAKIMNWATGKSETFEKGVL